MARKGWDALSPNYRARLEKAGITKTAYGKGASIQAARGHAATPERPTKADKFPTYLSERNTLTKKVMEKKYYWFSDSPKWNSKRSREKFRKNPPSMAMLRLWIKFTREEWLDAIREDPAAAQYLGYH